MSTMFYAAAFFGLSLSSVACSSEIGNLTDAAMDAAPSFDSTWIDPNCRPPTTTPANGNHNSGESCSGENCHDGNNKAPGWTVAGTLFTDKLGTTPLAGATMLIRDANGKEIELVTATNGNFFTLEPLVYPLQAQASLCPNTLTMTMEITKEMRSCSQRGCHGFRGNERIFVPVTE